MSTIDVGISTEFVKYFIFEFHIYGKNIYNLQLQQCSSGVFFKVLFKYSQIRYL